MGDLEALIEADDEEREWDSADKKDCAICVAMTTAEKKQLVRTWPTSQEDQSGECNGWSTGVVPRDAMCRVLSGAGVVEIESAAVIEARSVAEGEGGGGTANKAEGAAFLEEKKEV
jgi:hypothetical protein